MTEAQCSTDADLGAHRPDSPASNQGWYLYGITLSEGFDIGRLDSGLSSRNERSSLEVLGSGDLAAVVKPISLGDFSPDALARRAADTEWLESMVLDHNAVVAAVHEDRPILPAKFGSVYANLDDLSAALAAAGGVLGAQLERLKGTDEWAVHVYAERPAIESRATTRDPLIRRLDDEIVAAGPGRAYLLQRKRAEALASGIERASDEVGGEIYEELARHALAGQVGSTGSANRGAEEMEILRAAFLVERAQSDAFLNLVTSLAESRPGTRADYSGPWPPYSFVEPLEEGLR